MRLTAFLDKKTALLLTVAICLIISIPGLSQKIELKGKVIDFETRAPIPGVSVLIPTAHIGTVTDDAGMFKFLLDVNSYQLVLSYTGYRTATLPVYILDTNYVMVELKKKLPTELPEVTIESRKKDANVSDARMS